MSHLLKRAGYSHLTWPDALPLEAAPHHPWFTDIVGFSLASRPRPTDAMPSTPYPVAPAPPPATVALARIAAQVAVADLPRALAC